MSGIDVRDLAGETLARYDFPAARRADFRLSFSPIARDKMHAHAGADVSVEICGVLVGQLCQDEDGPFAIVEDCICCESATSKFAEVTFTHESWAQINEEMDTRFADKQIMGWYHSHPNFGVFLSDRDRFIHEHFFSGAGQMAYVIDPVRDEEGVFIWREGTTAALSHYWVGDAVRTSVLHDDSRPCEATTHDRDHPHVAAPMSGIAEPWYRSILPLLLATLLAFLLGTTYARMTDSWERQRVVEGVVAHYGVNKLVRIGLQEDLRAVGDRLRELAAAVDSSALDEQGDQPASPKESARRRRMIAAGFRDSIQALRRIGERFGFDDFERQALSKYVADKQAALRKLDTARAATPKPSGSAKGEGETTPSETEPAGAPSPTAEPAVRIEKAPPADPSTVDPTIGFPAQP